MAGRSTNLALMGLLVVALATGALAYAIGTSAAAGSKDRPPVPRGPYT